MVTSMSQCISASTLTVRSTLHGAANPGSESESKLVVFRIHGLQDKCNWKRIIGISSVHENHGTHACGPLYADAYSELVTLSFDRSFTMNDLFEEKAEAAVEAERPKGDGKEVDLEAGPSDAGQDMTQFFEEVNDVKTRMADIRKKFQSLQETNEVSKTTTRAGKMKALKEKMEKDLDEISKMAQALKGKIEALDKSNIANRKIKGCAEGSSADRTRMAITFTLKKKLKELMVDFQAMRQKFQDEYREVVERRVFTVTGQKVDDSVIERMIDTGDSEQIFQKAIQEQGRGQIMDTVAEIQERHDAVREIEKKLLELHQIFLDMAVLVEAQGELLDNIELNVGKAVEHIAAGTTALQTAKTLQRSTRKCMCIGIMILLITITVIVVAVVQPWKNS